MPSQGDIMLRSRNQPQLTISRHAFVRYFVTLSALLTVAAHRADAQSKPSDSDAASVAHVWQSAVDALIAGDAESLAAVTTNEGFESFTGKVGRGQPLSHDELRKLGELWKTWELTYRRLSDRRFMASVKGTDYEVVFTNPKA